MSAAPFRPGKYLIPLGFLALGAALLFSARTVLFPFVISAALSYLINPAISYFTRRGFKRIYIVLGIYLVALLLLLLAGMLLTSAVSTEISRLQTEWPSVVRQIKQISKIPLAWIDKLPLGGEWGRQLLQKGTDIAMGSLQAAPSYILSWLPTLTLLALVPFISFFFMLEGPRLLMRALDTVPSRYAEMAMHMLCEIDESLGNYLRGIVVEASALFALALTGLVALGLDYALVIAVGVGLSSVIPYLGPVLGGLVAGIAAFLQFGTGAAVLQVLTLFLALRLIDDWFLQPLILERAVNLHPLMLLFVLMAAGEIAGFSGLLLGVPAACILKVLGGILWQWHQSEFGWRRKPTPEGAGIPVV